MSLTLDKIGLPVLIWSLSEVISTPPFDGSRACFCEATRFEHGLSSGLVRGEASEHEGAVMFGLVVWPECGWPPARFKHFS